MSVSDFGALQKWKTVPEKLRGRILDNVFCHACGVTTIVNYSIHDDEDGIVIEGECKKCGGNVARFVENG